MTNLEWPCADQVAAELDRCEAMTTDELHHVVVVDGTCMWLAASGRWPEWTGHDRIDRALAAPICAGCPVWRECLELDFRVSGYATTSEDYSGQVRI